MRIKHPDRRLAICGLLATSLLTACGGGSSSSSGGGGSGGAGPGGGSYDLGYAQGTAATVALVLDDLERLQMSLAGSGTPVQTSLGRAVTISSLNLEPRQRAALAAQLEMFIAQVRILQMAAAADDATRADATAAQAAADDALRALQLVVAADTAAQAGGSDAVQEAAITALTRIAEVNPDASDARATINRELNRALETARTEVANLERRLALALAGQQGTAADAVTSLQTRLTTAQNSLNELTRRFGSLPSWGMPSTGRSTALPRVTTTYYPRVKDVAVVFDMDDNDPNNPNRGDDDRTTAWSDVYPIHSPPTDSSSDTRVFDPVGSYWEQREYDVSARGDAVTSDDDGYFNLEPDAVRYNPTGSNLRVVTATSPNTAHFPGRGTVYRGGLRFVSDNANTGHNTNHPDERHDQWLYHVRHRLIEQGVDPSPASPSPIPQSVNDNPARWNNWDAKAHMTFQYKRNGGFTMGFGGTGVIFSDLERYAAKGGRGPTATGRARASGAAACGVATDYCDDPVTANVEISFGAPQADPYNQPNTLYWYVAAQSPRITAAAMPNLRQAGDQIPNHDTGRYELILSNHAGTDASPNRQLAYAAYGLFNFFEQESGYIARMQTFHYGLDAFADDPGRRPVDLTGNNTIEGTFRGKTAAWIVTSTAKIQWAGHLHFIQNLFRARGDIELRACIGATGTNCGFGDSADDDLTHNRIAGTISNLQYAHLSRHDFWSESQTGGARGPYLGDRTIQLRPTDIKADGTYEGVADVAGLGGARPGHYKGAFYGPAGAGLETAGTWQINMANWEINEMDAIIGSFGAVCEGTCKPEPETP